MLEYAIRQLRACFGGRLTVRTTSCPPFELLLRALTPPPPAPPPARTDVIARFGGREDYELPREFFDDFVTVWGWGHRTEEWAAGRERAGEGMRVEPQVIGRAGGMRRVFFGGFFCGAGWLEGGGGRSERREREAGWGGCRGR